MKHEKYVKGAVEVMIGPLLRRNWEHLWGEPHKHMQGPTKESQSKMFYRVQDFRWGQSQLLRPPSHPLNGQPQSSTRKKTPIKHRPKRLIRRQYREYPWICSFHNWGEGGAELHERREEIYTLRPSSTENQLHETHTPSAAQARARRATRRGSEMPVWRGGPARRLAERAGLSQ